MAGPDLAEESEECEATVDFSTNYQRFGHQLWDLMGFEV